MTRLLMLALALALTFGAGAALAQSAVDWNAHEDTETVEIITTNEDGSARETTIWLCVLDGQGYVRGGTGRWVGNSRRSTDVKLRVDGSELALRAEPLTDAALIERVTAAYREKYGFGDVLAGIIRGKPTIFRLTPR